MDKNTKQANLMKATNLVLSCDAAPTTESNGLFSAETIKEYLEQCN